MKNIRFVVLIVFCFAQMLSAQVDTFSITESFRVNYVFPQVTKSDVNYDGVDEIYGTMFYRVNDNTGHRIGIIEQAQIVFQTEYIDQRSKSLWVYDFNCDGRKDIIVDVYGDLKTWYGPDYTDGIFEVDYYLGYLSEGFDRILENGETIPSMLLHTWEREYFHDNDTLYDESWECGTIVQGTWLDGRPDYLGDVCRKYSFSTYWDEENGTDYFLAGWNGHHLQTLSGDEYVQLNDVYFQMFTTYGRDYEHPDSLCLLVLPVEDENSVDAYDRFGFSNHSIVKDIDGDGDIEWIMPYWLAANIDERFEIHLPVYDPLTFEIEREYVTTIDDVYWPGNMQPRPIKGITAVNIDDDDTWEIMLFLPNQPIRILDPVTLEVIMESEFIIPNENRIKYLPGCFREPGRMQFMMAVDEEYVCFNLPRHWQSPESIESKQRAYPTNLVLHPPYPNPFNSSTRVSYTLPYPMNIELGIYDLRGRKLQVLTRGTQAAGAHTLHWDARELPAGSYLLRMGTSGGSMKDVKKVVLVR